MKSSPEASTAATSERKVSLEELRLVTAPRLLRVAVIRVLKGSTQVATIVELKGIAARANKRSVISDP
jgi:hypothetical protein